MLNTRNLEKGYAARVETSTAHQTLVRQMNWLDRNMESLLQQAPAPTVRFVHNQRKQELDTAVYSPPQPQHDATSIPISHASSSKSIVNYPKKVENPIVNQQPIVKEVVTVKKEEAPSKQKYSPVELTAAEKKRRHEFRQVQTRFCDTFKTVR